MNPVAAVPIVRRWRRWAVQVVVAAVGQFAGQRRPAGDFLAYDFLARALAPLGAFKGHKGYLIIIAVLHQWPALCEVMGKTELLSDPRFKKINDRVKNRYQLVEIIENWIAQCGSDEHVIALLEAARIPVAPVLTLKEAMEHPHLIERGTVRTVTERGFGTFQMPGMPLRFSAYKNDLDLQAPYLGEHNRDVLGSLLAYSDAHMDELEKSGVIVAEAIPEEHATAQ